ncbi:MAG: hypothetical protein K2O36_02645 [Ruminococcus sp.]|nr:hypothetical protein [Ruminococcus sp.]MDE7104762.1 hypothetical protein [Ruminococcus sp.]
MSRGVFWIVNDELMAFPFMENSPEGVAKSGNTYNHKKLLNDVRPKGCNKPYNYYPRGRVDISNKGKPIIYMNPDIDDRFIPLIKSAFGLRSEPIIRYDNSRHYKYYLDDGWKGD